MARWWSISGIDARLRRAALAAACVCALAACARDDVDPSISGRTRGTPDGLPTPAGTPGTSVTGMPTSPPPPPVIDPAEAAVAEDPTPIAGDLPAPASDMPDTPPSAPVATMEPGAVPAPPPPAPAPDAAPDPGGASRAITEYMAALSSGAFGRAQQQWAAAPGDGLIVEAARGNAFAVDVGPASGDPAGRPIATVPVQVRAFSPDGRPRALQAVYTLQRGTGATWRIVSASVRETAP